MICTARPSYKFAAMRKIAPTSGRDHVKKCMEKGTEYDKTTGRGIP